MLWVLLGAAALHVFFMIAELFPWQQPVLLRLASEKLPHDERFSAVQQQLAATIVHNGGVYNGIVVGGLLWAAFGGRSAAGVAFVMLLGAAVAGVFGTATLKSPVTAVQAAIGIIGLLFI